MAEVGAGRRALQAAQLALAHGIVAGAEMHEKPGAIVLRVDAAAALGQGRADPPAGAAGGGGDLRPACQPVPKRTVRRIAASLLPPIHSGSGCWMGSGAITASR